LLGLDGGTPVPARSKSRAADRSVRPTWVILRLADGDRVVAGETPALPLDIQVLHIERVVFYEFSSGFYVFAHQGGEDGFALGYVF